MENWRVFFYPLGFIAGIAFAGRFFIQWYASEKAKKSFIPRLFWQLSLIGNFCLIFHSFIQMQCPICLIQTSNAVISWRNLNLTQTHASSITFKQVVAIMLFSLSGIIAIFYLQSYLLHEPGAWLRIPIAPWQTEPTEPVSIYWHIVGSLAAALFASRFWIQWIYAENSHSDEIPIIFWWISLIGACLSIAYFSRLNDMVNLIGPALGIFPYMRNLMLILKTKKATV